MSGILQKIDKNARGRFVTEIHAGKYAGISYLDSMTHTVKCIETHNREFRDGKRGPRDAQRAKMHLEAAGLKNGPKRVLAFYLDIASKGKQGTCAPHDITADAVRRTTGGPCAQRTYERHLSTLCARGWLTRPRVPTGTRVKDERGKWTTLEVCKVTLTPAARLLIQKNHLSLPLPKRQTTEGDTKRERDVLPISLSLECDDHTKMERRAPVVTGRVEESPDGDGTTRPSPTAPTIEHGALTSATRKAAKTAASPLPTARNKRASAPKTWRAGRATLLAELFAYFHDDPLRDELHRVAELQTDPRYPREMVTALDWDPIVRRWIEMGWADRRRCLKNEIAPPLMAFCAYLHPEYGEGPHQSAFEDLAAWLQVIPDRIPDTVPPYISERLRKNRDRINMLTRQIHAGRVSLDILSEEDHKLLHESGFLRG